MKEGLVFKSILLPLVLSGVLLSVFLIDAKNTRAETETSRSSETKKETEVSTEKSIQTTKPSKKVVEQKVLSEKERLLFDSSPGDMIIVYNNDMTKSCKLIVKDQKPESWPLQLSATFPAGECVTNERGTVWYENIIGVAGKGGKLIVVPKENVSEAQQVEFGILSLFKKK